MQLFVSVSVREPGGDSPRGPTGDGPECGDPREYEVNTGQAVPQV